MKISLEEIKKVKTLGYPLVNPYVTQHFGNDFKYFIKAWNKEAWFYKEWISKSSGVNIQGHTGTDFRAKTGEVAISCMDGIVSYIGGDQNTGVQLNIQSETFTVGDVEMRLEAIYFHLSTYLAFLGQNVRRGQPVALTGNSGRFTTGPHLHFATKVIYKDGDKWTKDYDNGFRGAVNAMELMGGKIDLLPVDKRYGKKQNKLLEFMLKVRTPHVNSKLLEYGRKTDSLSQREINAMVYGDWNIDAVLEPAYFQTWSMLSTQQFKDKVNKAND